MLKPVQKEMFEHFFEHSSRKTVEHCSRRLGKTFFLCALSSIVCLLKPRAQVRYASVTQKAVRKMIHPAMRLIWEPFPKRFRPVWNSLEGAYNFKNQSQIHVAGVNNGHADDLRGTAADLAVVDEAGFVDQLSYLVDSVLMPQLMPQDHGSDGGRLVMASSSPLSPAHDFVGYIQEAKLKGAYKAFDIYAGDYREEIVEEFCDEAGGKGSTSWRREYLNEIIVDEEFAVVPEWDDQFVAGVERPDYFEHLHRYSAMDIGVRDKTGILWAYYDFPKARLVVEGEWTVSGPKTTTRVIADESNVKERELGYEDVKYRVADNNNLILLQDLGEEFGMHYAPTSKDSLSAMVNELRLWVQSGRVLVHPRCTELIENLKFAVFNKKRDSFERTKSLGHFDLLAALIYLVRNVDQSTNPIPKSYYGDFETYVPDALVEDKSSNDGIKSIFGVR